MSADILFNPVVPPDWPANTEPYKPPAESEYQPLPSGISPSNEPEFDFPPDMCVRSPTNNTPPDQ